VTSATPLHGPTTGGTLVTVTGARFAGDATVLFAERNASGTLTGNIVECNWRTSAVQGVSCNDTAVRWVGGVHA
jgi:hypothetical protein